MSNVLQDDEVGRSATDATITTPVIATTKLGNPLHMPRESGPNTPIDVIMIEDTVVTMIFVLFLLAILAIERIISTVQTATVSTTDLEYICKPRDGLTLSVELSCLHHCDHAIWIPVGYRLL